MIHKCFCDQAGHCQWHGTVTTKPEWLACRNGTPPTPVPGDPPCIYLAGEREDKSPSGLTTYDCNLHKRCTLIQNNDALPACSDCKDRLLLNSPDLASRFLDPLIVTDARKVPTKSLRGLLAGGPAFLVCGGPSVKLIDYTRLNERGIFSLGVNNVAGMVPVSAFTCSDPPMKFHWGIFADPRIMKFLPVPKLGAGKQRGQLRTKEEDGTFRWLGRCAKDCPNVWGYERRSWMMPDHTFFTEPHAAWGNQQAGVDRCDQPKTACTMLLGFRLLYHLGARTIFLLGADFRMNPDAGTTNNYAFAQARDEDAINSNNRQFAIAASWLEQLRPVFERFGLNVYNCNPESGLRAFDHVPFDDALRICRGTIPNGPFDLSGWYEKSETKEAIK